MTAPRLAPRPGTRGGVGSTLSIRLAARYRAAISAVDMIRDHFLGCIRVHVLHHAVPQPVYAPR